MIDAKKQRAIAALLRSMTQQAAAQKAGVSSRTLRRWLAEPRFIEAYRAAKQEAMERAIALMHGAAAAAVGVLVKNLKCGKPAAEIRAAVAILKGANDAAIDERLVKIEEALRLKR